MVYLHISIAAVINWDLNRKSSFCSFSQSVLLDPLQANFLKDYSGWGANLGSNGFRLFSLPKAAPLTTWLLRPPMILLLGDSPANQPFWSSCCSASGSGLRATTRRRLLRGSRSCCWTTRAGRGRCWGRKRLKAGKSGAGFPIGQAPPVRPSLRSKGLELISFYFNWRYGWVAWCASHTTWKLDILGSNPSVG